MRTRVLQNNETFSFFEMINLLLHGSVYLLRKELQCVRPGPDEPERRTIGVITGH